MSTLPSDIPPGSSLTIEQQFTIARIQTEIEQLNSEKLQEYIIKLMLHLYAKDAAYKAIFRRDLNIFPSEDSLDQEQEAYLASTLKKIENKNPIEILEKVLKSILISEKIAMQVGATSQSVDVYRMGIEQVILKAGEN